VIKSEMVLRGAPLIVDVDVVVVFVADDDNVVVLF